MLLSPNALEPKQIHRKGIAHSDDDHGTDQHDTSSAGVVSMDNCAALSRLEQLGKVSKCYGTKAAM